MPPELPSPGGWSLRVRGSGSLRRALLMLAAFVIVVAALETSLVVASYPDLAWLLGGYVAIGAMTALVGIWAWDRRPANRSGMLIVTLGLIDMLAAAGNIDNVALIWVGSLAGEAPIAALLHLVLAFPTGRLDRPVQRWIVLAGYAATVGVHGVRLLFVPGGPGSTSGPFADPEIAHTLRGVQSAVVAVILAVAAWLLVAQVRAREGDRREQVVLASVYAYGAVAVLSFPLSANLNRWFLHLDPVGLFTVQINVVASVPIVFAAAVLRGGFTRTWGIEELASWLGAPEARRPPVRDALATALGDPSLEVLFPSPPGPVLPGDDESPFIDSSGRPADLPAPGSRRAHAVVGDADAPLAVVVYDAQAVGNRSLVPAATRVLALALQRERLDAELRASREHLRAASARIVEASDAERRRIGQDLHDLVQSHLVLAAVHAGAVTPGTPEGDRPLAALRGELDAAMHRLRDVVQGIIPAILVERGLFAAVDALVDRIPIECSLHLSPGTVPLPNAVADTAYGIVNEALTNVVKHAGATSVHVHVEQRDDVLVLEVTDDGCGLSGTGASAPSGAGLHGIADRVEALGGTMTLTSATGAGTRLRVELPCAS